MEAHDNNYEARLIKVEAEIANLAGIFRDHASWAREESERTQDSIRQLGREMRQATDHKTDWKLLLGGLAVFITLGTVLGNMSLNPMREKITNQGRELAYLESEASLEHSRHDAEPGHTIMLARVNRLESEVESGFERVNGQFNRTADSINHDRAQVLGLLNATRAELNLSPYSMGGYLLWFQN